MATMKAIQIRFTDDQIEWLDGKPATRPETLRGLVDDEMGREWIARVAGKGSSGRGPGGAGAKE